MLSLPCHQGWVVGSTPQQRAHRDADAGLDVTGRWQVAVAAAAASAGGQHEAGGGQQTVNVLGGQPVLHTAAHEPVAKGVAVGA